MRKKYIFQNILEEALKYKTKVEFLKNAEPYYRAAQRLKIVDQVTSHMPKNTKIGSKPPNYKWTKEALLAESKRYKTRKDFAERSRLAYRKAIKLGMLDEICQHMPLIKNPKGTWTKESLQKEALKYNSIVDFSRSNSAYVIASRLNILNKICSHMTRIQRKPLTREEVVVEALKYRTRSSFQKNSDSHYCYAFRHKILDEICQHMKKPANVSPDEQNLIDIIKQKYPKAQKLRDRKINICNKPYIQGFDIDLYIPELRKGIEFDGTYWHSIPGLKRSRNDWPQEDLENYHKIKDEHFKSKGIQLIHIKEEDWIKDKEKCINECFKFLGNHA